MLYYCLPTVNYELKAEHLKMTIKDNTSYFLNETTAKYLIKSKQMIEDNLYHWKKYKKYTNPYEFIHTPYDDTHKISKLKPLSRAFYKMVEISNHFKLLENYQNKIIKTFHLAEGPGGFIEAFTFLRKSKKNIFRGMTDDKQDIYYGMTLTDNDNKYVPGWKKSQQFLEEHKNVVIENGITGDGNLYSMDNLLYCREKYGNIMDIITGDGGFDFSVDFNNQEVYASKLIFAQIMFAIVMQKNGGIFILKTFDSFTKISIDILYILHYLYETVYVCKPKTSRYANSEKYVVCKGFKGIQADTLSRLINIYKVLMNTTNSIQNIFSLIHQPIEQYFLNIISEINCVFTEQQIRTIHETIGFIYKNNQKQISNLLEQNVSKSIQWCKENNIPYFEYKKSNIFRMEK